MLTIYHSTARHEPSRKRSASLPKGLYTVTHQLKEYKFEINAVGVGEEVSRVDQLLADAVDHHGQPQVQMRQEGHHRTRTPSCPVAG